MTSAPPETQLDRIERKLDAILALRDAVLKLAMPRIPEKYREAAMQIAAQHAIRDRS